MSKEGANWKDCQSGIHPKRLCFLPAAAAIVFFDIVVGMIANVQFPVLLAPLNEEDNCQDGDGWRHQKRGEEIRTDGRTEVKRAGLNSSVYPDTAAAAANHDKRSDKERRNERRKGPP